LPDASENYLSSDEERILLQLAREALVRYVRDGVCVDPEAFPLTAPLRERHGAFVTLRVAEGLRGCIGYAANLEPLAWCVRDNAINAASRDPRFAPVAPLELVGITIEISALTPGDAPDTPFKRVCDMSDIVIGRDGLFVEIPPQRGGLLLPQVAEEQKWDAAQFLAATCRKAGYPLDAWQLEGARIYRFSAQVFSEEDYPDLRC
jgi:hypothetical protein